MISFDSNFIFMFFVFFLIEVGIFPKIKFNQYNGNLYDILMRMIIHISRLSDATLLPHIYHSNVTEAPYFLLFFLIFMYLQLTNYYAFKMKHCLLKEVIYWSEHVVLLTCYRLIYPINIYIITETWHILKIWLFHLFVVVCRIRYIGIMYDPDMDVHVV